MRKAKSYVPVESKMYPASSSPIIAPTEKESEANPMMVPTDRMPNSGGMMGIRTGTAPLKAKPRSTPRAGALVKRNDQGT